MTISKHPERFTLRLSQDLLVRFAAKAEAKGQSVSERIRLLMEKDAGRK